MKLSHLLTILGASILLVSCGSGDSASLKELQDGFQNPPAEARPQVWWHWMNGNITKDGIKKDITWFKEAGISGFHHFDAALDCEQIVDKRLIYMDEGWKDAFKYALSLADSLEMPVTVASSPGWSSTGGPWVSPDDAMKKIVWRTVRVDGGQHINMSLPEGYSAPGGFLNEKWVSEPFKWQADGPTDDYKDIAVIAVKLSDDDKTLAELGARLSSDSEATLEELTDDDLITGANPASWITYSFDEPETFRSAIVADARSRGYWSDEVSDTTVVIEKSDDGINFTKVVNVPSSMVHYQVISFPEVTAKHFRLRLPCPLPVWEFSLSPVAKVMLAPDKAGFTSPHDLHHFRTAAAQGEAMPLDITSCFKDGVLDWDAPEGRWKIIRFGSSLTGKMNHPAPPEATGLEVDKLDPDAWERYFCKYLDMYKDAAGDLMGAKGLQYLLTDSYEAQAQNWTPKLAETFKAQRGYDLLPWLPSLTGDIIGDSEQTEKFLWDFRMTIGKMFSDNYARIDDIIKKYGLKGRYTESHENGKVFISDGMDIKMKATVPMSATWVITPHYQTVQMAAADLRESASVAHLFGQKYVACESLTIGGEYKTAYTSCPENLKPVADREFAGGINRVVIHESSHQPCDDVQPGLGLLSFGQWFTRHETWAPYAKVWTDYLARTSYLLQQGRFVGDVLVYYGEDSAVCAEYGLASPEVPSDYGYDYLNPTALLMLKAKGGELVAPSGNTYKVLWLDRNTESMSVSILRKIKELADQGILIAGVAPTLMTSNSDSKDEFDSLVSQIWGKGRENVLPTLDAALAEVEPDHSSAAELNYVHRDLGNTQVYWVSNPGDEAFNTEISFRVDGLKPQLWHAEDGRIEDVTYSMADGRTSVSIDMLPHDAVFVVFSEKTSEKSVVVPARSETEIATIDGPWMVKFQENRGAPAEAELAQLISFSDSEDPGIKYFSGTATYSKIVTAPDAKGRVILDLGSVKNIAEVTINGEKVAVLWKAPFTCDITDALKAGDNDLQVKVTNLWVNRIIGDEQQGAKKYTFTPCHFYDATDALLPSGLIGPVKLFEQN